MPLFTKSQKKVSSRRQIAIQGVRDGVLLLPHHEYRAILQVSSLNFELKSDAEQDAIIDTYQSFLNSLASPIQILLRVREIDMDKYLQAFSHKAEHESNESYRKQILEYCDYVSSLISSNKILTRQFFIVVPIHTTEKDFSVIAEQLQLSVDMVSKGLARLDMQAKRLSDLELLDLFYELYSPAQAKRQPLSQHMLRQVSEALL